MNKHIFTIVTELNLTKKPKWLDTFRAKYDDPFLYHITLKTKTYFKQDDLKKMKSGLRRITERYEPISMVFNIPLVRPTSKGWCIMIKAKKNISLIKLQKEISKMFRAYGGHLSREYARYERKFEPHLTIGRHLTDNQLERTKRALQKNLRCETTITELVLTTVTSDTFNEYRKSRNKTHYKLLG